MQKMNKFVQVKTLLGHKGLPFSIECLQSFVQNAAEKIWLIIFEDGTLTSSDKKQLTAALPASNIVEKEVCEAIVLKKLAAYPACLHYRQTVVYARKIFDLMLYDNEDTLYIDSDVLFLKKFTLPAFQNNPAFMYDSINAYSFKPSEFLFIHFPIFPRVNSGFFFFPQVQFDLNYTEALLQNDTIYKGYVRGISWLEQTIWSFLASRNSLRYFNNTQVIMATEKTKITNQTICVHLVSTYRGQFEDIRRYKKNIENLEYETIELIPAKKHLKVHHFYIERITRKLKRYW